MGSVSVTVKVLDVNDNAPEFARFYEAFVCENAKAGQVRNAGNARGWGGDAVLHGDTVPERVSIGTRAQLTARFICTLQQQLSALLSKAKHITPGLTSYIAPFFAPTIVSKLTAQHTSQLEQSLPQGRRQQANTRCVLQQQQREWKGSEKCRRVSLAHVWHTRLALKRPNL